MIKLNIPEIGEVDALYIENSNDVRVALRNELAATCAGGNGAINVYRDSENIICCELMQYYETINKTEFADDEIDDIVELIGEWMITIN